MSEYFYPPGPPPQPQPSPPPQPPYPYPYPQPQPQPSRCGLADWLKVLVPCVLLLAGYVGYDEWRRTHDNPAPAPAVDAATLGRDYAPLLLKSYADTWDETAGLVEAGKPVGESMATFPDRWLKRRTQSFAPIRDEFASVLPEGTEPSGAPQRVAIAKLWRDFAAAVRKKGGK